MKKIFSTLCLSLVAVAMMAQTPVITFDKTEHDFGKVDEAGKISTEFTFRNEGMAPLILSNVKASCGCTTPIWPKEPIEPGQVGTITVQYNTNGRPGRFQKTITITSNASEPTTRVYIKGEVIPKTAKPVNKFPVVVGALGMKSTTLDLGTIKKGETKQGELEYTNPTDAEHQAELATSSVNASYFFTQVTLPTVKKSEIGKFLFELNTANNKLYGPVEMYAYVVVDGKKQLEDAYKLTIKANIVEDFSNLSAEQKQQAPIIETANEVNVGKLAAGKNHKVILTLKNSGVNPLEIRRVYAKDANITAKTPKAIKSGKKGTISLDINAKELKTGQYTSEVTIITNDYLHSVKKVKLTFEVE